MRHAPSDSLVSGPRLRPKALFNQQVDRKRHEATLARLDGIFRSISETAGQVSTWRCPYKNAQDCCTAGFGCRNQDRSVPVGEPPICGGDDKLDYRSAWEI